MTKFAVQIENQFGYSWEQIMDIVLKTEKSGYHSFYICDHFFLDSASEDRDALEAWSVLSAAAVITDRIHLGTLVTGNNYRNPALLAKIAATVDSISGGRMELGIGAGWKEIEYNAYGYDFPSVRDRMEMLEESLTIIDLLWTQRRATFEGKHYRIRDAVFSPKPNHPLVLIGGGGEKRTLRLVAKYADYMNLPFTPMDQIQRKLDALKEHCRDVGRDYDEVGKSIFYPIWVGDQQEVDEYISARAERAGVDADDLKKRMDDGYPGSWIGTPDIVRERIDHLSSMGFDYYFIQQPLDLSTDQIEKFSNLVMKYYT